MRASNSTFLEWNFGMWAIEQDTLEETAFISG